jgi:hypothetical protein
MKIQSFLQALATMIELRWVLPDGSLVPAQAPVVGRCKPGSGCC